MKRFFCLFFSIIVAFSLCATVRAEESRPVYLKEMGMEIVIPEEFAVFTRDNLPADWEMEIWGWPLDEIRTYLETNHLYLQAVNQNLFYEISIAMVEKPLGYLDHFSEDEISAALQSRREVYTSIGDEWLGSSVYQHRQTKFLTTDLKRFDSGTTVYAKEYFTVYADMTISINFHSYVGEFDPIYELLLEEIIDSVCFDKNLEPKRSPAREYCDEGAGAVFQISEGWKEIPTGDDFDGVQFSPDYDPDVIFLISSADIFSECEEEYERIGESSPFETRAAYDQASFTVDGAASALNCDVSEVDSVVYGGINYYYTERTVPLEVNGMTIDHPVVYFVRIENGIMYFFQYFGERESEYFEDVEQMLASAEYPHADEQETTDAWLESYLDKFSPVNLLTSLILTVTIYSLPIFIYRWCIRRYPVDRKKAKIIVIVYGIISWIAMYAILFTITGKGTSGSAIFLWGWINYCVLTGGKDRRRTLGVQAENTGSAPQVREEENSVPRDGESLFCHRCGNRLYVGHHYCNKCGTRIPQENKE